MWRSDHGTRRVEEVAGWLESGRVDLLAFNDHVDHTASKFHNPLALALLAGRDLSQR